jgi:hypothetical protein
MQLQPARFNALLNNIGQQFMWRQAFACPCVSPASGAAREDCPLCHGKAWQWQAEVGPAIAGCQNLKPSIAYAAFGGWSRGDALLTIGSDSALYGAGQYDRFRALNATDPFSANLIHGTRDYLLGTVQTFTRVFWLSEDGTTNIEGDLPSIDANGNLTWAMGANAPPVDATYSVSGVKFEEYFAYPDKPSDRAEHSGAALPKKLLARRFDVFGR